MPLIAPSLLSANFLQLQKDCDMLNKSEADWFHLDIMEGQFVPNISFGPMVVDFFRKATSKTLDVHLMIQHPGQFVEAFKKAGADILTVHVEACTHLHRNIQQIKSLGMKAGVAINPHTPVELLKDVMGDIDIVCVMGVNPGFGGQSFIPHTIYKINRLREIIDEQSLQVKIEIDGGVTLENATEIIEAGADILVAGSAVFNSADPKNTIARLKSM
jgi:ribulose-phosphate 3-epimerase